MKNLIIVTLFLLNVPLGLAEVFELKTNPEGAELFVRDDFKGKPQKVGKTPIKMELSELYGYTASKDFFTIEIHKEGFETFRLTLMKTPGADLKMDLLLSESNKLKITKEHDLLVSELFNVQKMIRTKNFSDALNKLSSLEKKYPNFSVIPELKGITYYMNRDVEKALSMFRAAFAINTDNADAYKMKLYLEKKMGIDAEVR